MDIYEHIGSKIRDLRDQCRLSQDGLAEKLGISTNTVSRWETATYKPSVKDLQKVADFFKIKLSALLPLEQTDNPSLRALMSATGDLAQEDIDEITKYAEYRRTRRRLEEAQKQR